MNKPHPIIDTHTHLDAPQFDDDREDVIYRAREAGVEYLINIGASEGFESNDRSIALAEKYDFFRATAGIHPIDATTPFDIDRLCSLAKHDKVVAIGETGLDFHWDSPKDLQYKWFRAQIELAKELKKPLVIHSRKSAQECLEVLKELSASDVGGVFHCYSEDAAFAEELKKINFLVSFPGPVTFKNARSVKDAVKNIPLKQIMVETDSPYLAPHPYRGSRNESAFLIEIVKVIAEIKHLSYREVAETTTATARNFYRI